jgi:hypothetical protein
MSSRCSLLRLALLAAVGTLAPSLADAHVQIRAPKQRTQDQKFGPCGVTGGTRSQNVCAFRPGATITLAWDETVDHPGHFRVSFDDDGVDDFVDPTGYTDFDSAPSVLEDNIGDRDVGAGDRGYSIDVTLPDVECQNCTLQLIQVMTDKPPWGPGGGNDIYYQCADIVLSATAPAEPEPGCAPGVVGGADGGPGGQADAAPGGGGSDAGVAAEEGGGAAGGTPGGAGALLVALALIACRRRRGAGA